MGGRGMIEINTPADIESVLLLALADYMARHADSDIHTTERLAEAGIPNVDGVLVTTESGLRFEVSVGVARS